MKIILFLLISLFSFNAFTSNYEVEFFFTADENHITPITSMYLAEYVANKW